MLFTTRFFYLLGLGLLPVMLGGLLPHLFVLGLVYDALLLALAAYDYWATIPRTGIAIERTCGRILSLGVRQEVTLRMRNQSQRALRLTVKDSPPPPFEQSGREVVVQLPPASEARHAYLIRPTSRGEFAFGDIFFRVDGQFGLTCGEMRVQAQTVVKVYPNVKQLSQVELAVAQASMVHWGLKPAHLLGEGTEFESLRDYVRDDDYRWIDWKATAKTNRLISREYETERNQRMIIAIDTGRLMGAKVGDFTKLDYAVNAAALLTQVGLNRDDHVGLLLFPHRIVAYLPPDNGRAQLTRIV